MNVIQYLRIDTLVPDSDNGRTHVLKTELTELTDSIKKGGIHTPLKVRRGSNDEPIVIGGHKRLAGAALADLKYLPCMIFPQHLSAFEIRTMRVLDNTHRSDMPPIDRAGEYQGLLDEAKSAGKPINPAQLAELLDVSVSTITTYLKLLQLPKEVQTHVNTGRVTLQFAGYLLQVTDKNPAKIEEKQRQLASLFIAGKIGAIGGKPSGGNTRPPSPAGGRKTQSGFARQISLPDGVKIVIISPKPLTDPEVATALKGAQGRLTVPIHGNKPQ
jgi:ParB/RepB/Spo0J family partition protein